MSEQKEMSQETRTLIAAALALAVIVAFSFLYKPQLPPNPPPQQTSPVAPQTPQQQSQPQSAAIGAQITSVEPQTGVPAPVHVATAEKLVEIDTPVSRIELSNRGAIVQSWLLTKYTDDSKPAHTLDVVHPDAAKLSGWPMSIVLEDTETRSRREFRSLRNQDGHWRKRWRAHHITSSRPSGILLERWPSRSHQKTEI